MRKVVIPVAVGALLVFWGVTAWRARGDFSSLRTDDVESVEVRLYPLDRPQPEPVRSCDPVAIRAILDALRPQGTAERHKCAEAGVLVMARKNGHNVEVWFLPGHDEQFYEYGGGESGRFYRADRGKFVAAMKKIGVEKVPVLCGQSD